MPLPENQACGYPDRVSCAIKPRRLQGFPCGTWLTVDATTLTPLPLTDSRRADAEARARKVLAEMGVTPSEASLFNVIHFGIAVPPSRLPRRAASRHYRLESSVTKRECGDALAACLAKGWLQVIEEPVLAKISDELREGAFLGPIYGFPQTGQVDFTRAGAELWRHFESRCFSTAQRTPFAYTDVVHEKTARFYSSRELAVSGIEKAKIDDDVVSVRGPFPIGPWRAQWWRQFPAGYRIEIEERRQWQGRGSGGGENCWLERSPPNTDQQRLRDVLDRHNVTFAEWILLAAMERGSLMRDKSFLYNLAEIARHEFGAKVSPEGYRNGLDACLHNGWLRVVDRQVIGEIQALLEDNAVFLAVPKRAENRPSGYRCGMDPQGNLVPLPVPIERRCGEVDFCPSGATLYRMISAEWLGRNWEDYLSVANTYYWEEHHYCKAATGFGGMIQERSAQGEVVRSSRVIPIGSWCVFWWKQFSNGYRLELVFGEP